MLRESFSKAALVLLVACGAAQAAVDLRITEIVTKGASGDEADYPSYVEIYAPSATDPFDLVVLEAWSVYSTGPIRTVITVIPEAGVDNYVIHEEDWPTNPLAAPLPPGSGTSIAEGEPWLSVAAYDTARTLLVFDHETGFGIGSRRRDVESASGLADVVTYSFNNRDTLLFDDEPVQPLNGDDNALLRLHDGEDYTDTFASGVVEMDTAGLLLKDGPRLNPGLVNIAMEEPEPDDSGEATAVPEPTALLTLALLSPALLGRRTRSQSRRH